MRGTKAKMLRRIAKRHHEVRGGDERRSYQRLKQVYLSVPRDRRHRLSELDPEPPSRHAVP
jgi:hypothetical protein